MKLRLHLATAIVAASIPYYLSAAENVIFQQLVQRGASIGARANVILPPPTLADGLDSKRQQRALARITDANHTFEALVRKSVVAPFVLKITEEPSTGASRPRRVDMWFVAYGDFDRLSDDEFVKQQINGDAKNARDGSLTEGTILSENQLTARGIVAHPDQRYLTANLDLFDRVTVRGTMQAMLTRSTDSFLVAAVLDPQFANDAEFPNTWRPMNRDEAGRLSIGESRPYSGMGWYCKATKLANPRGAAFIEYHIVFDEPEGWFHGANLLRSKLPLVVQDGVRLFSPAFRGCCESSELARPLPSL